MGKDMTQATTAGLPANLKDIFNAEMLKGTLTDGVSQGFPVISIRGSKWRVKFAGEEKVITNEDDEPRPSIDVVLLKGSSAISKAYYVKRYTEGSDEQPDCYSMDGEKPDPASPKKQSPRCMTCPKNQFGSRITDDGKKAKACSDVRRVAVLAAEDLSCEVHGSPMLLRVPAMSLPSLKEYGKQFEVRGIPYNAVVTRLGFDPNTAYPAIRFRFVRQLVHNELVEVAKQFVSEQTDRILQDASVEHAVKESTEGVAQDEAMQEETGGYQAPDVGALEAQASAAWGDADEGGEDTPPPPKAQPAPRKKRAAKKATAKAAEPLPTIEETGLPDFSGDAMSKELDAMAGTLDL